MGGLASVLPFLAGLKKSLPDFSGMTADNAVPPQGQDAVPAPNINAASPQPPPQATPDPVGDISQSISQNPTRPDLRGGGFTADAGGPIKPTKGHMLLQLLQNGLQGGLAGLAANAQTYAQTGRNAGFGGGYQGSFQLPFTQAYERGQLAQQGAQTELLKQQAQNINVPGYGSMPAGLARILFPALIGAQGRVGAAQVGAQGRTGAAQIGANARIQAAQLGLGPIADVPQDLQDQFGLPAQLPLKMLNTAESAANKPLTTVQGAGGPAIVNKQTKQTTSLGLGAPALARPVQVSDPNNPGIITYQTAGQAISQGAQSPQSATAVTAKATARAVAPGGRVGEEINAFNTAIQHADLLQKAADSLHNGDQQTLNSIKNRFANEFGATGPITANTIAQAYTREISKMLTSGHMTDSEIGAVGSTLDPNRQSLPQMQAVIGAYRALAASKMQVRQQGVQQGLQGKPNFGTPQPPPGASHAVIVNGKTIGYTSDGKTMTPAPQ